MEKRLYYFTFGSFGDDEGYNNCVQPILASDWTSARKKMLELHGNKWGSQFGEKAWNNIQRERRYKLAKIGVLVPEEKELPVIEGD